MITPAEMLVLLVSLALPIALLALLIYAVVVQRALARRVTQLERTVEELQRRG